MRPHTILRQHFEESCDIIFTNKIKGVIKVNNNFSDYLSSIHSNDTTELTREHLITGTVINIKRIILELQELENIVVANAHDNVFAMLILGSQLENVKRELIKIKQEYQKK
jgi:hypothetical protein